MKTQGHIQVCVSPYASGDPAERVTLLSAPMPKLPKVPKLRIPSISTQPQRHRTGWSA
jgi:hypothetical protein